MTTNDIQQLLDQLPDLCAEGFGASACDPRATAAQREAKLRESRVQLLESTEECSAAEQWLKLQPKTDRINREISSYGLKNESEEDKQTYISNGAFIAAAFHAGFSVRHTPFSPNAHLNIGKRVRSVRSAQLGSEDKDFR